MLFYSKVLKVNFEKSVMKILWRCFCITVIELIIFDGICLKHRSDFHILVQMNSISVDPILVMCNMYCMCDKYYKSDIVKRFLEKKKSHIFLDFY